MAIPGRRGSSAIASTRANWGSGFSRAAAAGRRLPAELHGVRRDGRGRNRASRSQFPARSALYERDGGIAWKHGDETRRARDLVLFYSSEAGNYDYGFEWIFHQDGTLEMRVLLTGIMSVKSVADGAHDPYSHMVGKNLAAVHHQHFFSFPPGYGCGRAGESRGGDEQRGGSRGQTEPVRRRVHDAGDAAHHRVEGASGGSIWRSSRRWIVTNPGGEECARAADRICAAAGRNARAVRAAGFVDSQARRIPECACLGDAV